MKKGIAMLLAVVMVLAMGMTSLAAGTKSPTTTATNKVTQEVMTDTNVKAGAAEAAKSFYGAGAEVLEVLDVNGTPGNITLYSDKINAGDVIRILHWNGSEWEPVEVVEVGKGYVIGKFTSLSPVTIIKVSGSASATSPKTGYWG